MDKKYMGKFISSIREEKKLTQEEIANNLGVSVKIIKKIEKGKFKLESPIIVPLCNELGITIYEFLNGRKGDDRIDQMDALNVYSDYLKKKRFKKIIKMVLGFIFILFYVFALIWMNNNKDLAYELYGESKNFSYKQSFFLRDNRFYLFVFGNYEIKNSNITKEDITKVTFRCNDRLIVSSSDFLYGDITERKGYDEYFPDEVVKNLNDWVLEIKYKQDEEIKTEIIELKNEDLNK